MSSNGGSAKSSWKHKHTKTLPWGADGAMPHGSPETGGSGDGEGSRRGAFWQQDEDGAVVGLRREREEPGGVVGREGYRLQMMPSPSTGSLSVYKGGRSGDGNKDSAQNAGEKEQLRRKLSLLKKKMHSQAGSRRSQSAGPRAGELGDDADSPNGTSYADSRIPGRQKFHMTTGTAPAMMPSKPGAFLADGIASGRGSDGRSGRGHARPPPEGPGSPYAVNPYPRRTTPRSNGPLPHRKNQHDQHEQHKQQQRRGPVDRVDSGRGNGSHAGSNNARSHEVWPRSGKTIEGNNDQSVGSNDHSDDARRQRGQRFVARRSPRANLAPRDESDLPPAVGGRLREEEDRRRRGHDNFNGDFFSSPATRLAAGRSGAGRGAERARRSGRGADRSNTAFDDTVSHDRHTAWAGGRGGGGSGGAAYAVVLPPDAFADEAVELEGCRVCGRNFNPEALERHARSCRPGEAKRKVFNAAAMRMRGTELEQFAKSNGSGSNKGRAGREGGARGRGKPRPRGVDEIPVGRGGGASGSKWRQQSSQFREAIRQARVVTNAHEAGMSLKDLPPTKPSAPDPSLVPCPHCGRRFNEQAGERHMQHCKNIKAKPSLLKKGSGSLLGHAARKNSGAHATGHRW